MKKAKRYQEGGVTINQEAPSQPLPGLSGYGSTNSVYPFQSSGVAPATSDSGVNKPFNIQPTAQAGEPTTMNRGGKVKSASQRADGCAIRGKTRA